MKSRSEAKRTSECHPARNQLHLPREARRDAHYLHKPSTFLRKVTSPYQAGTPRLYRRFVWKEVVKLWTREDHDDCGRNQGSISLVSRNDRRA